MTEHERWLQGALNLVAMLEKMYKTDIKTTADYMGLYRKWELEGKPCLEPKVVRQRGSKSLVGASGDGVATWNPMAKWDRKKNPIKWSDLL